MSRTGKRRSSSTAKSRARRAIALLLVIAACLVAVLVILPSRQRIGEPEEPQAGMDRPPASTPKAAARTARRERVQAKATLAVVIDDVGYNLEDLQAFLDFPGPITLSVLPNLPYSSEAARRIVASGKELMLHLPMEAENGNDPGPGAILTDQKEDRIRSLLETGFSQMPQAAGMNNHMGSKATADLRVMNIVMEYLSATGRYFLDSRTTTETLGPSTAKTHGVPYLERDIFLDNEPQVPAIREALEEGIVLARKEGSAILIGHVRNPQIVEMIGGLLLDPAIIGVELVSVSDLLEGAGS